MIVINTAGLEVPSNASEVFLAFRSPTLTLQEMSIRTAAATLSWTRAISGFEGYEVNREIEAESGTRIMYATSDIDDTTFVDSGLTGSTTYTYTLTSRSSTGRELTSNPVNGQFHALLREWRWDLPSAEQRRNVTSVTIDDADRLYISLSGGFEVTSREPELEEADRIYQFMGDGENINQFPPDPSPDPTVLAIGWPRG